MDVEKHEHTRKTYTDNKTRCCIETTITPDNVGNTSSATKMSFDGIECNGFWHREKLEKLCQFIQAVLADSN